MKAKIICTIGPSSASPEVMGRLLDLGMTVARFNLSHGNHEEYRAWARDLRHLAEQKKRPLSILCDLQGPKIRLGHLPHDQKKLELQKGMKFSISNREPCRSGELTIRYQNLIKDVKAGERILIDDGRVELKIVRKSSAGLAAIVSVGGVVAPYQGVNLPETSISLPAVSPKDEEDLAFALDIGADAIGLSFTRSSEDVGVLRDKIAKGRKFKKGLAYPFVIAKIERREAVENIDSIIRSCDVVMVARGDLGIEIPEAEVPLLQKQIIDKCITAAKPVITATQMLDSMKSNPRPTRAEVSDVANAIIDGTDCVMLSGETTTGEYPVEAAEEMEKIILETEKGIFEDKNIHRLDFHTQAKSRAKEEVTDSVGASACEVAAEIGAKYIVCATASGHTARAIAKARSHPDIIALTPEETTYRNLGFVWGVRQYILPGYKSTDELLTKAVKLLKDKKLVGSGEKVVITAGHPVGAVGTTNLIKVEKIS